MVITIDGPAGAGKSTVARALARRLGFRYLDTGAMYRAVAWAAMDRGVPWDQTDALVALIGQLALSIGPDEVRVNGRDIRQQIRSPVVTAAIHHVADNPRVREQLVQLQRQEAARGDLVTEGRDQGTVAFPAADCKIFLTASTDERARRRLRDLRDRGEDVTLEEILEQQESRDHRDQSRPVGRLEPAPDAVHVNTDGMTCQEVVERLAEIVLGKK